MKQLCKQHIEKQVRLKYTYLGYKFNVTGVILECLGEHIIFDVNSLDKLKSIKYTEIENIEPLK